VNTSGWLGICISWAKYLLICCLAKLEGVLSEVNQTIESERLKGLLGRGLALSQAIDRWQTRSIWVVSRADAEYPQLLKDRLKDDRPAVIYGCGERSILEGGGLAVVGSRDVDDALD
jgi:DNA processing protein